MAAANFFKRVGTRVADYWKQVGTDYATVLREVLEESKKKPLKAAAYTALLGGLVTAYRLNPSYEEMEGEMIEKRQQMVLIPNSQHNPQSDNELAHRSLLFSQNRLDYYNFWLFSLLVRNTHDSKVRTFQSQDGNLRKWYLLEFYDNILDIGYLGKWHHLDKKFVEFDLNHEELENLVCS